MEKYQGVTISVTLLLLIGAALSESFLKVTWSAGLLALIGLPLAAIFADKAARALKKTGEEKATTELNAAAKPADDKDGKP